MRIHIDSGTHGDLRTVKIMLTGDDNDFIDLIDEGSATDGILGVLTAKIAAQTGLVAERADDRAQAARLMRRAAEVLERSDR